MNNKPKFIFFGTPEFSVTILEELKSAGYIPSLIVTQPDRPKGRKFVMTPPPVKTWALENSIEILQPENLNEDEIIEKLKKQESDLFIVASYGVIISQEILDIPEHGTLNVHTSLLPKLRGASPIESVILAGEKETGTTIMLMDEKMDHGPIISQDSFTLSSDMNAEQLEDTLAHHGGKLLVETIPGFLSGEIKPVKQNHDKATYCGKIEKSDGELFDTDTDLEKYRKYLAYFIWPQTFFFDDEGQRIKITKAKFENKKFVIEKIIPEGKTEIEYKEN